jgi:hypothetical protein
VLAGEQFLRELIAALVPVAPGAGEIIVDPGCADREQFGRDADYDYDYEL